MAISFSRYIAITSGLAAGGGVSQRELILRLVTQSVLLPPNTIQEFSSADSVSDFFGATSGEALRAAFYFGFVSKSITQANNISFVRWAEVDTAPIVAGADVGATLAEFQAVTAGTITIDFAGNEQTDAAIDLSSATSFTDVASQMQVLIRALDTDPLFLNATVTYDAVSGTFTLTGGATGVATVTVTGGGSPDVAALLGWLTGATISEGVLAQTITEMLTDSTATSDNFGSYAFIPTLTTDEITESATWNDGRNVEFQYYPQVTEANKVAVNTAIIGLGGTGMTLYSTLTTEEYPELLPAAILASTKYENQGSVQNYMFYPAALTSTVTTDTEADANDALRVNYYGQSQKAGRNFSFYQRGFLTGTGTDPVNMNTYANEQWLKSYNGTALMNLFLALPRVPANTTGRGQVLSVVRGGVDAALNNGTISVGKALTTIQIAYITAQSGSATAYRQVQSSGYWLDAEIVLDTVPDPDEYKAVYTLIYAKDDAIRKVDGSHILV